jgi:PAS domain S-box-containing protein
MADIKRLTPPSILLVEDNPLHVRLVTSMLEEVWPGYEDLYQARRLDRALEHIRDDKPDCVLLDLVLPDADGLEAVNVILASNPEVPIVVLSSHDDQEMALRAVSEGAQDYLVKGSVDAWELARSIKFAIYRHKSRIDGGSGEVVAFPTARVTAESVETAPGLTPAGMAMVDTGGVLRHGTSGFATLFGRPLYELIGTAVEDLVDPDDIGGWRIAMSGCRQDPAQTHTIDLRIHNGHGTEVPTSATLRAMWGADGEVDAVLLACYLVAESVADVPGDYVAMSDWNV